MVMKKLLNYTILSTLLFFISDHLNAQQKIQLYDSNQDCDLNKKDRIVFWAS